MYEQLRTHIAIPHIANKSATKHSANNHYIRYQQQPYMLQTPTVYATNTHRVRYEHPPYTPIYRARIYIHNHETTTNTHEHNEFPTTKQQQTYTGEINLPLRLTECTPTIRGMYATHFIIICNTFRKIFDVT